jgi:hypothetical protein
MLLFAVAVATRLTEFGMFTPDVLDRELQRLDLALAAFGNGDPDIEQQPGGASERVGGAHAREGMRDDAGLLFLPLRVSVGPDFTRSPWSQTDR